MRTMSTIKREAKTEGVRGGGPGCVSLGMNVSSKEERRYSLLLTVISSITNNARTIHGL